MHAPLLMLGIPVVATLAGGLTAIRFGRFRTVLLAFGAGLLLGAVFLDLLPEALEIGGGTGLSAGAVLGLTLLFFLIFSMLESGLDAWSRPADGTRRTQRLSGRVAGGMLIFHSFRDGMAIGAAFAASSTAGYAVATGVAAHDFGDGMNTVIATTGGEPAMLSDYLFLLMDAVAPFLGGLLTTWWLLSSRQGAVLLALTAGFFLQMATNDFLPQTVRDSHGRGWLVLAAAAGAGLIYASNLLLG